MQENGLGAKLGRLQKLQQCDKKIKANSQKDSSENFNRLKTLYRKSEHWISPPHLALILNRAKG